MPKFIFRIDDVCPEMDWKNFKGLMKIFDKYNVKPLLAVIPDNRDEKLKKNSPNPNFWPKIKNLINAGYVVGMHGYQHKYETKNGGLLKISKRSEFAGLPYGIQFEKIKKGKEFLKKKGLKTDIFIAPGHSFDKNTIKALRKTGFKYISDGISLWPFEKYGIIWIPQISGKIRKLPFGIITFCLHPNNFTSEDFLRIENFIKEKQRNIVDFNWVIRWFRGQKKFKRFIFDLLKNLFKLFFKIFKYIK